MNFVGSDREKPGTKSLSESADELLAIRDILYQQYALGDVLTTQLDLALMALERGIERGEVTMVLNPGWPSVAIQGYGTRENYVAYLDGLVSAFMSKPTPLTLHFIRGVDTINHLIFSRVRGGAPLWPEFGTHLRMRQGSRFGLGWPMSSRS